MTTATTVGAPPAYSPGRRWAALAVLCASLIIITMDMTILTIALPDMAADLKPTSDQQLWIVDVYSLVLAGLLVSVAAIADRWGRKRMLILGYVVFAVASLLVLFANSAAAVIAIRALLGIGGAMIMPTTLSLIRVIFTDPKERTTALSVWAAVSGVGMVIGPLVGGVLLEHFGWHAAFLINVPLMILAAVAALFLLRESRVTSPGSWDVLAAALSLVGLVALVWALKLFGKEASFAVPNAWIALAVAVVTLFWFGRRSLRREHPLLDLRLFENRVFTSGMIAAFGATFAMIAALLLISQWLLLVDGSTPIQAGVQLMPIAIVGAVASLAAPLAARLMGARAVQSIGLVIAGGGLLYIGLIGNSLNLTSVIIALCLVGVSMGALAIGTEFVMGGVPEDKAGNAGALQETAYEFSGTLGVSVLGSIAAVLFRENLGKAPGFDLLEAFSPELAGQAQDSLGAAMYIAQEGGLPELAVQAAKAFTEGLQVTGVIGGVIMIAFAIVAFFLVPKGTKIGGKVTH